MRLAAGAAVHTTALDLHTTARSLMHACMHACVRPNSKPKFYNSLERETKRGKKDAALITCATKLVGWLVGRGGLFGRRKLRCSFPPPPECLARAPLPGLWLTGTAIRMAKINKRVRRMYLEKLVYSCAKSKK